MSTTPARCTSRSPATLDLDVPLDGTGAAQSVTLEPSSLDFGSVAVGDSALRSFTLTSTGNVPFQSIVAIPSGGDVGAFHVEQDGCSCSS